MLLGDPLGGGPPNVLQAGQNTLWVSGTPFTDDCERPRASAHAYLWLHGLCAEYAVSCFCWEL